MDYFIEKSGAITKVLRTDESAMDLTPYDFEQIESDLRATK